MPWPRLTLRWFLVACLFLGAVGIPRARNWHLRRVEAREAAKEAARERRAARIREELRYMARLKDLGEEVEASDEAIPNSPN